MRTTGRAVLVVCFRLILGVTFVASGVLKLVDLKAFDKALRELLIVPEPIVTLVAFTLPVAELATGLGLLLGFAVHTMTAGAAVLVIIFIAVIIPELISGSRVECGCFGRWSEGPMDFWLLLRDLALLAMCFVVYRQERFLFSIDSLLRREQGV